MEKSPDKYIDGESQGIILEIVKEYVIVRFIKLKKLKCFVIKSPALKDFHYAR
jgi:hypothetical protein